MSGGFNFGNISSFINAIKSQSAKVPQVTPPVQTQPQTPAAIAAIQTQISTLNFEADANAAVQKISDSFSATVDKTKQINQLLETKKTDIESAKSILEKYAEEVLKLTKRIKGDLSDAFTNDRKTYYEDQGIDNLKWWHYLFLSFYIIVIIAYVILFFVASSNFSISKRIWIFVLLVIYPFVAPFVFTFGLEIIKKIISFLPKNAYLNI
jgi:hypothetical protein